MTRKTIGYVELAWTCPHCETENPGPRRFCTACGAPQPHDVQFHQMDQAILLTEEADIRKAKAGPDIHCPYCRARNPGDAGYCGACGGDLSDAAARESGQIVGAFRQEKRLEKECPHCGTLNPAAARECAGCGGSLPSRSKPAPAVDSPVSTTATTSRKALPKSVGIGCVAVILIGIAALLFVLLSKEEMKGTVQDVEWIHSIPIMALAPVEREDWWDQVPPDAENLQCQEELRETLDEYVAGAVEVCGTPYTIDEGSGYGEVVQDCTYDVYDDFCTYTVMDWAVFDVFTVSGDDLEPYWPELTLQADQQAGEREAEYNVLFSTDDGNFRYAAEDELEFMQYLPGTTWIIEVNKLGGVSVIEPAR
jgi:hypothetical protein